MLSRIKNNQHIKRSIIKIYAWLFVSARHAGCHQRPDRSFFYKEYQFPMCARCTGVMIGYLIAIPIYFIYVFSVSTYISLCVVMFLDWYIQYLKIKESTNFRRLISGVFGGFGLMSLGIRIMECIFLFLKVHL